MSALFREKIQWLFAVIVITLTLTIVSSAWVLYDLLGHVSDESVHGVESVTLVLDEQRQVQVIFKRQIQEWKDLLLRGSDEADYQHYLAAFNAQAVMAQNKMASLARELRNQGLNTEHLQRLQRAHTELTQHYLSVLKENPLVGRPEHAQLLDARVRGMDRGLSAEFDVLWEETRAAAINKLSSVPRMVMANHEMDQYFLFAILLVVLPAVGYGSLYSLSRLTRQVLIEKEKMQVTLSSIGDAVVVTDRQGLVEYLNPVAEQMTGWTHAEAAGKPLNSVFNIINEQTRLKVESPVEIVLREGHIVGLANHTVLVTRDGRECAIEDSAAPLRDLSGQTRGVVLVFHDATLARSSAAALARQEALFRATFEHAGVGVAHIDPFKKSITLANSRFLEMLGYSLDEMLQLSVADLTLPEDREAIGGMFGSLLEGQVDVVHTEKRCPRKDGSIGWSNISLSVTRHDDGSPDLLVAVLEDISAKKQAELEAHAMRVQYQTLFDQMPDAVMLFDLEARVVGFNQEALRQYEYAPEALMQLSVLDLEAKESPEQHLAHRERIQSTGRDDFETRHRTRTGRIIDVQAAVRLVELPNGSKVFQAAFRDISSEKKAHHQIEFLANHDHLTGLPNRRLLRDRMDRAIGNAARHQTQTAMLFLDMDHFKVINDTLGHEVGDLLLTAVADRLRGCVREQDTISRIGGDEFVVVLVDLSDSTDVANVAQKIVDTLSVPYLVSGYDLHTSPSIGISLYPSDGKDFDLLLQRADAAMYHAKENGRSGYRFYKEEMNFRTQERLTIEHDLHRALEQSQFELYYQPKVHSQTGKLIGAEALIRWNHPEKGMVSPGVFIPVAEQSNLINGIGDWVARTVCRQTRIWQDTGLPSIPVSFNVSARQFLYSDLPVLLESAIDDTGANPSMLEIELTESVLMRPQEVEATLAAIKAIGFSIALDDFGTGYSSLAYLRKMAVDTIKIDRSFVKDLENNPDDAVIVRTLIATALNLNMGVIAEGVETEGQARILRQAGCDDCQGYYFGKPVSVTEFTERLAAEGKKV